MSLQEVNSKGRHVQSPVSKLSSNKRLKRSLTVNGHKTSLSLEKPFWDALTAIREKDGLSLSEIVLKIEDETNKKEAVNLSSAIRIYVLKRALGDVESLSMDIEDLKAKLAR